MIVCIEEQTRNILAPLENARVTQNIFNFKSFCVVLAESLSGTHAGFFIEHWMPFIIQL